MDGVGVGAGRALAASTALSRALAGGVAALHACSYAAPAATLKLLALTPGTALPYFYTMITAGFYEDSMLGILLFAVAIMLLGRILEPAFGTVGFLRFLAAVNAANGAGVFACCVAGYALTQNANAYLYVRCRGVDGLVAAMLVALKAVLPRLGLPSEARPLIRAQALPVLALCAAVVLAAADVLPAKRALGWALGTFNAWLFLRHVQPRLGLMPLGEEEQLTLLSFVPLPPGAGAGAGGLAGTAAVAAAPGPQLSNTASESSRKRERGLRALEERLAAAEAMENDAAASAAAGGAASAGGVSPAANEVAEQV